MAAILSQPHYVNKLSLVTHICISELDIPIITGSCNGLSPIWHQAIFETIADLIHIEP